MKKSGFTLAEVLVTLGIVGVIASLTIPALIQNYRNIVVETRLKKFYTTFNQALQIAEAEYGDKKLWYIDARGGVILDDDGNASTSNIDNWFAVYMKSLKIVKKEINTDGSVIFYLPDGSSFHAGAENADAGLRIIKFYTSTSKACNIEGVCKFTFAYMPNNPNWKLHYNKGLEPLKYDWDGVDVEKLKNGLARSCYNGNKAYCAALIQANNWKIPKDYPYKVRY